MIPKLYDYAALIADNKEMGDLADCISCKVTQSTKGVYECEFKYPVSGRMYKHIKLHDWITAVADENGTPQPFEIYRKSATMDGIVTYNCRHAKYRLGKMVVMPYQATMSAGAMAGLTTNNPVDVLKNVFTFNCTYNKNGLFKMVVPMTPLQILTGGEGSILDVYGGALVFDGFTVTLQESVGQNTDMTIIYGKNLTDLSIVTDGSDTYNIIVPYWHKTETNPDTGAEEDILVTNLPQYHSMTDHMTDENDNRIRDEQGKQLVSVYGSMQGAIPVDMSQLFDEEPQPAELFYKAQEMLIQNEPWKPTEDINLGFIPLWQTEEYKDIFTITGAAHPKLYDIVHVYYAALDIAKDAQVVQTIYDTLLNRYESIAIETIRQSFADTLMAETASMINNAANSVNERGRTLNGTVYLPTEFNADGTAASWVAVRVKKGIIE